MKYKFQDLKNKILGKSRGISIDYRRNCKGFKEMEEIKRRGGIKVSKVIMELLEQRRRLSRTSEKLLRRRIYVSVLWFYKRKFQKVRNIDVEFLMIILEFQNSGVGG